MVRKIRSESAYRRALADIALQGGAVATSGKTTVVIVPCVQGCDATPKFYRVSTAVCSADDWFDYRQGTLIAYQRLQWLKYIVMKNPYMNRYSPQDAAEWIAQVLDMGA